MEILSYSSGPCCHVVSLRWNTIVQRVSCSQMKLPASTRHCTKVGFEHGCRGLYQSTKFFLNKDEWWQGSRSSVARRGFQNVVSSGSYDGYVMGGTNAGESTSGRGESPNKVLIPGLPDEPSGAQVTSCFWEWKPKLSVHYEKSGCENVSAPPVLFLPGFGVGSFHYENQLKDLGCDHRVWAIDFLGQGKSLPVEDPTWSSLEGSSSRDENPVWGFGDETAPWATKLVYSIDLWQDQVRYFIEEVIGEPVYIVGNSLGGFVALYFAACNPQLVKGVTLLNATPFWGFLPNPVKSPRLARLFRWDGTFPLPANVRKVTEIIWEKLSNPQNIRLILKQVYADHSRNVDELITRILETTHHPAAVSSLASIMCAPQGQLSFNEALSTCQMNNVPVCLMYGREDPWVKPIWGLDVKRRIPEAPYYEISPAGHCPHDEVPEVVNYLLRGWIKNLELQGSVALPLHDDPECARYNFARELEFVRQGSKKSVRVHFFGSEFSLWKQISSFVKSRFQTAS